jgi:hypothetical protein
LQRYFVSMASGSPFSAAIFFLLRNVSSPLPTSGRFHLDHPRAPLSVMS